jgi:hypothetical protein
MAYFWEFMLPNTKNYFLPPLEKLETYNLGLDDVFPIAQYWFRYKTTKVASISKNIQGPILYIFRPLFLIINLYFIANLVWFFFNKSYKGIKTEYNSSLLLIVFFHFANFIFCVFATIVVFRYQVFPMITCVAFALLLTEWLDKKEMLNMESKVKITDGKNLMVN